MTRGIAPLILGYQAFDKNVSIKGVILNRLGGSRHEGKLRNVIEHYTDVAVVGAIHNDQRFDIEERHLGLVPGHEDPFCTHKINLLAEAVNDQVDIDAVLSIAGQTEPLPTITTLPEIHTGTPDKDIKLGLVRCSAFGFYYPDDLQALQQAGAEIIEIDPCHQTELPDIDALFIGGGFPETHMTELEANKSLRTAIKSAIDSGLPTYAECGGLMYLSRSIEWNGEKCDMVGSIDTDIIMEKTPQGRGYVQLQETEHSPWPSADTKMLDTKTPDSEVLQDETKPDKSARIIHAHEFHYSRFKNIGQTLDKNVQFAFQVKRGTGINGKSDGYIYKNLLANYTHQRNTWNNPWAQRFINFARAEKQ
jgi:cobyrinic acid a,c-diamide synthase